MTLIDFISLISEDQDIIVLYRLDARKQEYVKVGKYWKIEDIPIIYAHMCVNAVLGFAEEGYDCIKINVS